MRLLGRDDEVDVASRHLVGPQVRLLTLTGTGGVGKTSLALAVAAAATTAFEDGVCVVDLAPLRDPALVIGAVGRALALRPPGRQPMTEVLSTWLRERRVLLVLDNFEHLPSAAPEVASLLAVCPAVRVLATSRTPLGLPGEHELPVGPLALPDLSRLPGLARLADTASVALFVQCATAVQPAFQLDARNAPVVAEICVRLDGLPLAIELAAVRVKTLGIVQVLDRLRDRFRLLAAPSRAVPERHRSLRRTIDWSFELLSQREQTVFLELSVFTGGWDLEAAEAVCADDGTEVGPVGPDVVDVLGRLVDHSLVVAAEHAGQARYRMLETLRAYGAERLAAAGGLHQARERHRAWFLHLAERAEAAVGDAHEAGWLDRLEFEHDNLRAALDHSEAVGVDSEPGLRLAGALPRFWDVRGHLSEGCDRLDRLLRLPQPDPVTAGRAKVLNALGTLALWQGEQSAAQAALEDSARLGSVLGDVRLEAWPLSMLAFQAFMVQDLPRGRVLADQAYALADRAQDEVLLVRALAARGVIEWLQGDHPTGWSLLEQSLSLMRRLGGSWGAGNILHLMGWCSWLDGDPTRASALEREAVVLLWALGDRQSVANSIEVLALAAVDTGRPGRCAWLLGVAARLRDTTGGRRPPYLHDDCVRAMAAARGRLGAAGFDASWSTGRQAALVGVDELLDGPAAEDRPGAGAGGLTPREVEAAWCVVQGMTNRQIATALTISERTAERHLENVRVKLGVTSRAQIAAWAVGHRPP